MNNSIFTIAPYKFGVQWVFDDARVGLDKEALVAGADTTLDLLSKGADKCTVLFSRYPFPGSQIELLLDKTTPEGTDYHWFDGTRKHDVWLCPALFLYYPTAPTKLYIQVKVK